MLLAAIAIACLSLLVLPAVGHQLVESAPAKAHVSYVGKSLINVLKDYNQQGYKVIFSSVQVNRSMIIAHEPVANSGIELLNELLEKFDLTTFPGPNNTQIIKKIETQKSKKTPELIVKNNASQKHSIEKIEISASQYNIAYSQSSEQLFMDKEEIEQLSHLANDLTRAISNLPGVAGGNSSAKPYIRGGHSSENLYLLDGMPLYSPFHLKHSGSYLSTIDAFTVGDLQLITGGSTVEYGDHLTGVVNIRSQDIDEDYPYAIGMNFLDLKAKMGGKLSETNNSEWFISLKRGFFSVIEATSDVETTGFKPLLSDVFFKVKLDVLEDTELTWHSFLTQDSHACLYQCVDKKGQSTTAYHWLNANTQWQDNISSSSVFGYGTHDRNRNGVVREQAFSYHFADQHVGNTQVQDKLLWNFYIAKQDWRIQLSEKHMIKTGFEFKRLHADFDYLITSYTYNPYQSFEQQTINHQRVIQQNVNRFSIDDDQADLYFANLYKFSNALTVESGLRWQQQSSAGNANISPRINIDYLRDDGSNFKASWGEYQQRQSFEQVAVSDGLAAVAPPQKNHQLNLSYQANFAERYQYKISLYENKYRDISARFENVLGVDNLLFEKDYTRKMLAPTKAHARGMEFLLQQKQSEKFSWWLAYTLSETEEKIGQQYFPRQWDQRHAVNFSVSYQVMENCKLNVIGNYHTGWRTTPVTINKASPYNDLTQPYLALGDRYSKETPKFFRVDMRFGCESQLANSRLRYFVEAINVFNRDNSSGYTEVDEVYGSQGQVLGLSYDGGSYVPFIPSIGIVWEF